MQKKKGVSLIVLVITIIVMIILVGTVIINMSGGILDKANEAREEVENASEIDMLRNAGTMAIASNKLKVVAVEPMQKALDKLTEVGKTTVIDNGDTIAVRFNEQNKYYEISKSGEVLGVLEVELDNEGGVLDGVGTADEPFIIMSIDDLVYFAKNANTFKNKYVELGTTLNFNSDLSYIDKNTKEYDVFLGGDGTTGLKEQLTKGLGFKPINYTGTFDGKNNTIKNIKVEVEGNAGLFAGANGTIMNINVQGDIISTGSKAGGIIGYTNGGNITIKNCSFNGSVKSLANSAGGIVGQWFGGSPKILNCSVKGEIISSGTSTGASAGGIIGQIGHSTFLTVDSSINYANVQGNRRGSGGILGGNYEGNVNIKNSSNFGLIIALSGTTHDGVGGIVGTGSMTIENCYNGGILKAVYGVSGNFRGAGGMLGNGPATINNSVHNGIIDIEGTNQNLGGIIGIANNGTVETVKLKQCYFNNETIAKGIGKSAITGEIAIGKTNVELQSEEFVNELNSNIQNGCPYQVENEDGTTTTATIDTTGWAKWVYNAGSYPTLDLKTKWNGTAWITEK